MYYNINKDRIDGPIDINTEDYMETRPTYTELLNEIEHLERLLKIAEGYYKDEVKSLNNDVEYWHMRAVEAEDDRDRLAAKLDELDVDD